MFTTHHKAIEHVKSIPNDTLNSVIDAIFQKAKLPVPGTLQGGSLDWAEGCRHSEFVLLQRKSQPNPEEDVYITITVDPGRYNQLIILFGERTLVLKNLSIDNTSLSGYVVYVTDDGGVVSDFHLNVLKHLLPEEHHLALFEKK